MVMLLIDPINHHGPKGIQNQLCLRKKNKINITNSNKVGNDKLEGNQYDKTAGETKELVKPGSSETTKT